MRVYKPATLRVLAAALDAGSLTPGPAYAVTEGLRAWVAASGDGPSRATASSSGQAPSVDTRRQDEAEEELEFVALSEAARDCLRLLASGGQGAEPPVRVVVVVDVADAAVAVRDENPGEVDLLQAVPVVKIMAAYVDGDGSLPGVEAAVAAVSAADRGDQRAEAIVDAVDELLWYAAEELPALVSRG
jgi:hypothetical protein